MSLNNQGPIANYYIEPLLSNYLKIPDCFLEYNALVCQKIEY